VWECWNDLEGDRPVLGGGFSAALPGQTPWRSVMDWADRRGVPAEEADFLVAMIRMLDAENLAISAEQAKQRSARR
jgi:hypothetical protein